MSLKFNKIETEDGTNRFINGKSVKKNAMTKIKTSAMKTALVSESTPSQSIQKDLDTLNKEENEKKILIAQLNSGKQKVNEFLLNKYTDGNNTAVALIDQYDNSKKRIEQGLLFEYHVYMPEKKELDEFRGNNKYVISPKINDFKIGDIYYYHIPVYVDVATNTFITDYGEELHPNGTPKTIGLLSALIALQKALKNNDFSLPNNYFLILKSYGFLDGKNQLTFAITGNMKIEKYLLNIKPEKKAAAIQYLDSAENIVDEIQLKKEVELEEKIKKLEDEIKSKDEEVEKLKKNIKDKEEKKKKINDEVKNLESENNNLKSNMIKEVNTDFVKQISEHEKQYENEKSKLFVDPKTEDEIKANERINAKLVEKLKTIDDLKIKLELNNKNKTDNMKLKEKLSENKKIIDKKKEEINSVNETSEKIKIETINSEKDKIKNEKENLEKKPVESESNSNTVSTTNETENNVKETVDLDAEKIDFNYDDTKDIYTNLISNGYKVDIFRRNAVNSKGIKIDPLLFINHKNKSFYIILDYSGAAGELAAKYLNQDFYNKRKKYEELLKNKEMISFPLSDLEKKYLLKRDVVINNENPITLTKSAQFVKLDKNNNDDIIKYYNNNK